MAFNMSNYTPKTDLNFKGGHAVSTDLNFGQQNTSTQSLNLSASISITEVHVNVTADYDANVFRPISSRLLIKNENANRLIQKHADETAYTKAVSSELTIQREKSKTVIKKSDINFESTNSVRSESGFNNETSQRIRVNRQISFENTELINGLAIMLSETAIRNRKQIKRAFYPAEHHDSKYKSGFDVADYVRNALKQTWSDADAIVKIYDLLSEKSRIPLHPKPDDIKGDAKPDYIPKTLLNFECPWTRPETNLDFGTNACQYQPKQARIIYDEVIFVTESVSLVNLDTGNEIDVFSGDVGIDNNSYLWSFNADIAHYENIPDNTLVELTINGHKWRFLASVPSYSEQFNGVDKKLVGYSQTVLLGQIDPRAYAYNTATSAQQIINNELSRVTGFSYDYQINDGNDWIVPANTYGYSENTPINTVQDLAEAGGGFISSHMTDKQVLIKPNYPSKSWEWTTLTPNIVLDELIESYSVTHQQAKNFNGVWVSGEENGVLGNIKRNGTDGAIQAEQVIHPLLTEQSIAISRGMAELSKYGTTYIHDVSTPLHNDIGVLVPSDFAVLRGKNAIVRAVNISFSVDNRGALIVNNKLKLESK